jgi:hypothetical protein
MPCSSFSAISVRRSSRRDRGRLAARRSEVAALVHTTSALRYPVFVAGKNYGDGNP